MNIEEAIDKLNSQLARYRGYELPADKAIQIGLEASSRIQYWREKVAKNPEARPTLEELQALLPSETE